MAGATCIALALTLIGPAASAGAHSGLCENPEKYQGDALGFTDSAGRSFTCDQFMEIDPNVKDLDLATYDCTRADNPGQRIPSTRDVLWLLGLSAKTRTKEGHVLGGCCSDGKPKCGCDALSCRKACIVYGKCYPEDPGTGAPATEPACAAAGGTWCPADAAEVAEHAAGAVLQGGCEAPTPNQM